VARSVAFSGKILRNARIEEDAKTEMRIAHELGHEGLEFIPAGDQTARDGCLAGEKWL